MTIRFNLFRKNYELEAKAATVAFGGQTIDVVYPTQTFAFWAVKFGSRHAPLFYSDFSPVLGEYKAPYGRTITMQLVIDVNNGTIVTEIDCYKKGTYSLKSPVQTRLLPGKTLFKL